MGDLPADGALVHVELLGDRGSPHRALLGDVGQHQVRRRREVRVHRTGPRGDDPLDRGGPSRRPPARGRRGSRRVSGSSRPDLGGRLVQLGGGLRGDLVGPQDRGPQRDLADEQHARPARRSRTARPPGRCGRSPRRRRCSKIARTGPGSELRSGIEWLSWESAARPRAARPLGRPGAATWWLSTAPSAATPIEPPMLRKNATTELAAPMSAWAVLFCTASTRFCMVAPRPTPRTAMKAPTSQSEVCRVDGREQAQADDDGDHAADEVPLPEAGAGDDPAGGHARDDQAADHRDGHQAGVRSGSCRGRAGSTGSGRPSSRTSRRRSARRPRWPGSWCGRGRAASG